MGVLKDSSSTKESRKQKKCASMPHNSGVLCQNVENLVNSHMLDVH